MCSWFSSSSLKVSGISTSIRSLSVKRGFWSIQSISSYGFSLDISKGSAPALWAFETNSFKSFFFWSPAQTNSVLASTNYSLKLSLNSSMGTTSILVSYFFSSVGAKGVCSISSTYQILEIYWVVSKLSVDHQEVTPDKSIVKVSQEGLPNMDVRFKLEWTLDALWTNDSSSSSSMTSQSSSHFHFNPSSENFEMWSYPVFLC